MKEKFAAGELVLCMNLRLARLVDNQRGIPRRGEVTVWRKDDDRSPGPLKDIHATGAVDREPADMA